MALLGRLLLLLLLHQRHLRGTASESAVRSSCATTRLHIPGRRLLGRLHADINPMAPNPRGGASGRITNPSSGRIVGFAGSRCCVSPSAALFAAYGRGSFQVLRPQGSSRFCFVHTRRRPVVVCCQNLCDYETLRGHLRARDLRLEHHSGRKAVCGWTITLTRTRGEELQALKKTGFCLDFWIHVAEGRSIVGGNETANHNLEQQRPYPAR